MGSDIRRLFTAGAVVVAVMAVSVGARAAIDGNKLYRYCRSGSTYCAGYVTSIAHVMSTGAVVGGFTACTQGAANTQMVEVVKRFLERHPEARQNAAGRLVAQALAETFPCK